MKTSTTGTFSKGPPCSNTGERGRHEEISDGDPGGGGGDPDSTDGGVEPPLGEEEPSLDGERECLVPLLTSNVAKRRKREENHKQRQERMRDDYQCKTKEIFIASETSRRYSNEHHFGSHTPTQVHPIENRAS
jgi:hypothetical protein